MFWKRGGREQQQTDKTTHHPITPKKVEFFYSQIFGGVFVFFVVSPPFSPVFVLKKFWRFSLSNLLSFSTLRPRVLLGFVCRPKPSLILCAGQYGLLCYSSPQRCPLSLSGRAFLPFV